VRGRDMCDIYVYYIERGESSNVSGISVRLRASIFALSRDILSAFPGTLKMPSLCEFRKMTHRIRSMFVSALARGACIFLHHRQGAAGVLHLGGRGSTQSPQPARMVGGETHLQTVLLNMGGAPLHDPRHLGTGTFPRHCSWPSAVRNCIHRRARGQTMAGQEGGAQVCVSPTGEHAHGQRYARAHHGRGAHVLHRGSGQRRIRLAEGVEAALPPQKLLLQPAHGVRDVPSAGE